jgi:hypothetical protein
MYNKFFEYLLDNNPEKVISKFGIKLRKAISPAFRNLLLPLSSKNKWNIEKQAEIPKNVPIIFACTHGFRDDMAVSLMSAKTHSYLLLGSLPAFYYSADGIGLWINGVIMVDRKDKESRKSSKEKMIRALNLGTNVLMFPEGVWNKTENLVVQKLFPGVYDVAKETGAVVVPIATIQEGKNVYASVLDAFDICQHDKQEGLNILRDKLATEKYELMDKYSHMNRSNIGNSKQYWNNFLDELISTANGLYDYEIENVAHYQDKRETTYQQAFEHLNNIEINKQSAFLFNKRLN